MAAPRHRYSLRTLLVVMSLVAVGAAYVGKLGVYPALAVWCGIAIITSLVWGLLRVLSVTRGRVRFTILLFGTVACTSIAGLTAVTLWPLKEGKPLAGFLIAAELFQLATLLGAIVGLVASALGSWFCADMPTVPSEEERRGARAMTINPLRRHWNWPVLRILFVSVVLLGLAIGWFVDHRIQRQRISTLQRSYEAVVVVGQEQMEELGDTASCFAVPWLVMIDRSDLVREVADLEDVVARTTGRDGLRQVVIMDKCTSDEHIRILSALNGLTLLWVTGGTITNDGVQVIVDSFPQLESLRLSNCPQVTGEGIDGFSQMKRLQALDLWRSGITSAGIEGLQLPQSLTRLDLNDTSVDDRALDSIARLTNLQELRLWGTNITDDGLEKLAPLKNLRELYLAKQNISDAAVNRLQQNLPACRIFVD